MKRLLCVFLALALLSVFAGPAVLAEDEPAAPSLTAIEPGGAIFKNKQVTAGNRLVFNVTFKSLTGSAITIKSIQLLTSTDLSVFPFEVEYSSYYQAGSAFPFDMRCRSDAAQGYYTIPFDVVFSPPGGGADQRETVSVSVLVVSGEPSGGGSTPKITITGYRANPDPVVAGAEIDLSVTFKNNGSVPAKNIKIQFSSDGTFTAVSGSSSIYLDSIAGGGSISKTVRLKVKPDAAPGSYAVTFDFSYDVDGFKEPVSDTETVSVPVIQVPKIQLGKIQVYPEDAYVGQEINFTVALNNIGKSTLYNAVASFADPQGVIGEQSQYLGNIAPGATGNIDVYLPVLADGEADLTLTITYESETGEVFTRAEHTAISAATRSDVGKPVDIDQEKPADGAKWIAPVIIILLVLAGVGLAVFFVLNKKKKADKAKEHDRKQAQELERRYYSEQAAQLSEEQNMAAPPEEQNV